MDALSAIHAIEIPACDYEITINVTADWPHRIIFHGIEFTFTGKEGMSFTDAMPPAEY